MKRLEIAYHYRGRAERGTGKSKRFYVWREVYSTTSESGAVSYPWLTYRECQAEAKQQGARAVFYREGAKQ